MCWLFLAALRAGMLIARAALLSMLACACVRRCCVRKLLPACLQGTCGVAGMLLDAVRPPDNCVCYTINGMESHSFDRGGVLHGDRPGYWAFLVWIVLLGIEAYRV
jgi:hypothetical protein